MSSEAHDQAFDDKTPAELYSPDWSRNDQSAQHTFQNLLKAAASEYGQNHDSIHYQNALAAPASIDGSNVRTSKRKRKHRSAHAELTPVNSPPKKRQRVVGRSHGEADSTIRPAEGQQLGNHSLDAPESPMIDDTSSAASVLFRPPSEASKKYTRPPMAKIFGMMGLSPQEFLDIQAAAKAYMLDERHLERSESVGAKTRGDADLTKLKLFTCVKSFLEDEGWGERCWGQGSENIDEKTLKWPEMKNQIITALTPLMRRMVTNERQRRYARKSRQAKHDPAVEHGLSTIDLVDAAHLGSKPHAPISDEASRIVPVDGALVIAEITPPDNPHINRPPLSYLINILNPDGKVDRRHEITGQHVSHLEKLLGEIEQMLLEQHPIGDVQALTPSGLIRVASQDDWVRCQEEVRMHEWMEGLIRIVVTTV